MTVSHSRLPYLATAAALGVSLTAMPGTSQAATEWDMPTPYGDRTFHTVNIREFTEDVREATDGELDITVHSNGSLIGHAEIKNSVRRGIVPMGEVIMSRLANENPIFEVDSVPYLAASYEEAWTLWEASREIIAEELQKQGLRLLFTVPWPPQGIYTNQAIESGDDLRNLSMRAYNTASERIAQLVGAVPTQVEVPDIPTAFSTGRVEAMITSPATGADTKAWDYLNHFNHAQLWLPKNMIIVSEKAFSRLPEANQQALLEAAAEAETRGWEMSRKETDDAIAVLEENGITVTEPSEALAETLKEVGDTMTEEWVERAGEQGQMILDAYRSARE
ncbi:MULTISPECIES: TRAP transporter substrate-binding protein [unclassified Halomonas]|uniref:TRAP transporter substrate-binding protein n=1 Tax=unclassified Halomonas TaxID=2609666 RepID=UPI002885D86E|nr:MULTISPECIES: TRAP transporter substrate-binding protein [unclassified Halomonas]MDT0500433.1 TRAP transporter substrate-binding protein [Halomonas sp. PAR7]MDT0511670.1 TRAP transporter substrate-binding protein [Halomonas sp. LES1]MDT0590042.1 TRAP transporter substrate-binding protein [Halomonas sp. PAR8]